MKKYLVCIFILVLLISITACDNNIVIEYTLEVEVIGQGEVQPAPGIYKYSKGSVVTLAASPAAGYIFSGWSGPDGGEVNNENEILMNKDMKITAVFTALAEVANPVYNPSPGTFTGSQFVTISCTTEDADIRYTSNGEIPTATNGTLYNGTPIEVNDDKILKAVAVKDGMLNSEISEGNYIINYDLDVAIAPTGSGSVSKDPDNTVYKYGDTVTLTAEAATGYSFSNWTGDLSGSNNPDKLTIDDNKSVTAEFTAWDVVADPQFSVEGGTYNGVQQLDISCTTTGAEIIYTTDGSTPSATNGITYEDTAVEINDDTTLKAIALKDGMTDSNVITADYIINYSLTTAVNPSGGGSIGINPDRSCYKYGKQISLEATAAAGYSFSNWSGDLSGSTNPDKLIINANKSVTAEFEADAYNVLFTVLDEADNPLEGATVSINSQDKTTDASGETTFSLTAGTYSYTVSYNNFEEESNDITVVDQNVAENVTLLYYASTAVELDSALSDSSVTVINLDNSEYDLSANTCTVDGAKTLKSASASTVYLNIGQDISGITNNDFVTMKYLVNGDLTVNTNISLGLETIIDGGNLILTAGTLDINSQNLTVSDSILHRGGTLNVNNGTVDVGLDYLIQAEGGGYSAASLIMTNSADRVNVAGDFVMDAGSHKNKLTDGILDIKGNFTQLKSGSSFYAGENFYASGSHRVILSGAGTQTLSFATPGAGNYGSNFATLELDNSGTINFASNVVVNSSLYQRNGTLNVNANALDITGDYIIEEEDGSGANAILQMTKTADYITVGGKFLMDSNWSHSDKLTAGTLEVKGDFTRQYNSHYAATYSNFDTSDTHRVILSGSGNQTVNFANSSLGSSCFAELEVASTSTGTITFDTITTVTEKLINNNSTEPVNSENISIVGTAGIAGNWPWNLSSYENWTLAQDIDIDGNYYLLGNCTLDTAAYVMNLGGSFYQRIGTLNVNGSTINIAGDYIIEKADGNNANALLQMTNAADHIIVDNNFVMNSSWSHSDKLTAGTLEIKGDFTEKYDPHSRSTWTNFQASGNHKVLLSGSGTQSVMFETHSSATSCFANLELDNTGTLEFASRAAVTGNIINNLSTAPTNITKLYPAGTAKINSGLSNEGEWPWDMAIYENWTLAQDIDIDGDYYLLANCTLDTAAYVMDVGGNFYQREGTLNVNGSTINITGNYIIEKEDESCAVAYLQMTDAADYITVGGNFIMHSQYSSNILSAGTLELKGDFTQKHKPMATSANDNFQATGSHKVILSGSSQSVSFTKPHSTDSCFANLELNNTGTLEFASRAAVTGNIINNMSTVPTNITNLYPAGIATINSGLSNEGEWQWNMGIYENWTLQHNVTVDGDLHIFSGTVDENGYILTVNGSEINH